MEKITNPDIAWRRKRKYWGPLELNALIAIAVDENGAVGHTEGQILSTPRDVTVDLFEVSDYGIIGITFAAADLIYPRMQVPHDLDINYPVGFRVNFTQSAAVSVGVTWILKVGTDKKDAVIQAEDAAGIAVLDKTLVEKNAGGSAWENLWTNRGVKTAIGLTQAEVLDGAALRMCLECDVVDGTIADITLLGIEMDYVPIKMIGTSSLIDSLT